MFKLKVKFFLLFVFYSGHCLADNLTVMIEEYPPYNFSDTKTQTIKGISVDMVSEVAKRKSINVNFQTFPWARALRLTEQNKKTCLISTFKTAEREKKFKWIGPVVSDNLALFAAANSKVVIHSISDAKKYTVGTYLESATVPILKKYGINYEAVSRDNLNPKKLNSKRIDLWIANSKTGPYIADLENVQVKQVFLFDDATDMYMACNKNMPDSEVENLNKTFKSVVSDGTQKMIEAKYRPVYSR